MLLFVQNRVDAQRVPTVSASSTVPLALNDSKSLTMVELMLRSRGGSVVRHENVTHGGGGCKGERRRGANGGSDPHTNTRTKKDRSERLAAAAGFGQRRLLQRRLLCCVRSAVAAELLASHPFSFSSSSSPLMQAPN